jgi:hypothetical protein
MTFINAHSYKCLLGPQAKEIMESNEIFAWKVGKKQHFTTSRQLKISDLPLLQSLAPSNFHYLSENNASFLKEHYEIHKAKNLSIILDIKDLSFPGNQFKNVRHCLNKCGKQNLTLERSFRNLNDIKSLINEWSNEYTEKYFRDFSGKNMFFYKNNFHQDCINLFVYHQDILVAFGTLTPNFNGTSSYVIGKALYKRIYGLSEWTDVELYKIAQQNGIHTIQMGQASKGLLGYKTKFPYIEERHFDGNIEV